VLGRRVMSQLQCTEVLVALNFKWNSVQLIVTRPYICSSPPGPAAAGRPHVRPAHLHGAHLAGALALPAAPCTLHPARLFYGSCTADYNADVARGAQLRYYNQQQQASHSDGTSNSPDGFLPAGW
jgi:hypothetical protein